ncbi:MAG TPA: oxidoreductase [Parvularcula sp.]|nr:oxidoreductase [Parvularcula sp.]
MSLPNKSAVVTGVSSGIGRAIAKSLTDAGWRVFGSVRRERDAIEAAAALGGNFSPLIFDVTDEAGIARGADAVRAALKGETLGALVNNAGIAVGGPVACLNMDDLKRQIDINVYGPIRAIKAFAPLLGADRVQNGPPGRIVNMSSVAGKIASPFMSPYAMSKHALEAMSESLRREMVMHGIDVVIVGPGAIRTPIWAKADEIDFEQYRRTDYFSDLERMKGMMQSFGEQGLEAGAVGKLVLGILMSAKPKTRYAILKNKFMMWTLPNLLPKRMVDSFVAKRFGLKPRTA